ncbi:MAG: hypothetical protein J6Q51_02925 [Clostridia bacterium]|nr:hypothetical protein [Clostridia bacterium]
MKKKFLCFIFAFIFVFPFTFMLSGCFNNNPPTDPPTEQGPGEGGNNGNNNGENNPAPLTVNDVLSAFNSKTQYDKYTANVSVEYTDKQYDITNGYAGSGKTNGLSLPNITLKVEEDNFNFFAPSLTDTYVINGNVYSYHTPEDEKYVEFSNKPNNFPFGKMIDTVSKIQSKALINYFVSVATTLKNCSANVVEQENQIVLNINLDLAEIANNLMATYVNNSYNKISVLLNTMFKDLTGNNGNILAVIDEFKQSYTDNTTVQDLNNFIESKTGINVLAIADFGIEYYNLIKSYPSYSSISTLTNTDYMFMASDTDKFPSATAGVVYQKIEESKLVGFNVNEFAKTKLSSYIDTTNTNKTSKELVFEALESYLNNDQFSADMLMVSLFCDGNVDNYVSALEIVSNIVAQQAKISAQICFDTNYSITKVSMDGIVDLTRLENETTKDGYGQKYTGNLVIEFKDYGTTTVTAPTVQDCTMQINYYVSASELLSNPMISLNFVDVKIKDFDIIAHEYDERTNSYKIDPIKVLSYNSTTKLVSFNKLFIEKGLTKPDCNSIEFRFRSNTGFILYLNLIIT